MPKDLSVKESTTQKHCVEWFTRQYPDVVISSFPNDLLWGDPRKDPRFFAKINHTKAMGFNPGMPDLIIFKGKGVWNVEDKILSISGALLIEMKRKGQKPTEKQTEIHAKLRKAGYQVEVATSLEEFMTVVKNYMEQLG